MKFSTDISNILVIGCGGAGLRSAIEAKKEGLSVKILGKRNKDDAHTVLAAGGINAAFGNVDNLDSWEQHFADTYIEGYGIGDPEIIEIMTRESPNLVSEIDKWGSDFAKLINGDIDQRFFGAHTYRRTCYCGDYTGQSILKTLLKKTQSLEIPIFDSQYVTELLVKDNVCFGAFSFNTKTGEKTAHYADAVILCTGGHTRIWKKSSSRKYENNGDGFYLGLKAGCELIDMEMVQFHPTGMLFPEEVAGTLVTEAVRGEGGRLFNSLGERFMTKYDPERMELSTRDRVAIANYTEILEGRGTSKGGVYLDISHKSKDLITRKLPKIYRQFIELQNLDITKNPMEVAPTAHYSMGGIMVSAREHKTCVNGLFAAGEVAGGLHGANRLGGNSLAEILVFGKKAGQSASNYSKKLKSQIRSAEIVQNTYENLETLKQTGDELSLPLQTKLYDIMWEHAGVVKNKSALKEGLTKINKVEEDIKHVEVRTEDNNYTDLINILDLKASLMTAKATLVSALTRKESRGAHQRSDFKICKSDNNFSYKIKLENNELTITSNQKHELKEELKVYVDNTKNISNFKNKLLE
ncbi:FAD-dependent oxidoreductase [Prochlorococcus sp. AH-716-G04]|nr:FAD-dependent oxidoreductase [Prochlorococcus sp. AH-716-G04]